ncbi:IS66-like element accessory protein TnpA [Phenylobacterium conjunctum]|uniref:Transposase n=1 Tax=Phenylobacterium conjunctum TaxID=1298959 RepID=A0ABW3T6M2_9CAUL
MAHVTLMSGPERRRRWSADEQREILMAAFSPGAVVADVARQYEVATSLIYKWRREVLAARDDGGFVPAVVVDGASDVGPAADRGPAIVIELPHGARVTISADTPAALVTATLRALR